MKHHAFMEGEHFPNLAHLGSTQASRVASGQFNKTHGTATFLHHRLWGEFFVGNKSSRPLWVEMDQAIQAIHGTGVYAVPGRSPKPFRKNVIHGQSQRSECLVGFLRWRCVLQLLLHSPSVSAPLFKRQRTAGPKRLVQWIVSWG